MSIESFFDHKCDIYHIVKENVTIGYGLPPSPCFSYPSLPDIKGLGCHFGVKSQSVTITRSEPINIMEARIKLTLPAGTDIRLNDKIVDCETGFEYTAEEPHNIRNHHIFVNIKKVGEQRDL